jgi:lipopolysaccharide transport system ATP-binding protein
MKRAMADLAFRVEHLGKRYRIGQREAHHDLRDTLAHAVDARWRAIASLFDGRRSLVNSQPSSRDIWALKDISFEVKRGEAFGIIGGNGAGKTTLLKILSRITEPTEGRAEIYDQVGSLLEVGTGFHPELTGRDNIYLNGAILGMKKADIDRTFDAIVDFSGVEKFIDTPVKHYSSGMYVRLAFSVAAHLNPRILLVDEVLAVGDVAFQRRCLGKMDDMTKEGRTVLFVSHSMSAMLNLTQTCIWVQDGRIVAMGKTPQVVDEYMSSLNASLQSDGWADLSRITRSSGPGVLKKARFTWVRLLDAKARQAGSFSEGEPITVELGFQVMQQVTALQFGCGIGTVDGGIELFTSPSRERSDVADPGNYSVRMHIEPNYLRNGDYAVTVKLFADGQEQETMGRIIRLNIRPRLSAGDPAYFQRWATGHLRFDYEWESIRSVVVPDPSRVDHVSGMRDS